MVGEPFPIRLSLRPLHPREDFLYGFKPGMSARPWTCSGCPREREARIVRSRPSVQPAARPDPSDPSGMIVG